MKILYIITQSEFGGAQRHVFDLAANFTNEHTIFIAAGGNGELFDKADELNIKTYKLKFLRRAINPFFDLMAFFELAFLISTIKPDITHLHSSKAGAIGAIAAKLAGVKKVIYTAHGFVFNEPSFFPKKKLFIWAERISGWFKNKVICVSEKGYKSAIKLKVLPEKKLVAIHNGIGNTSFLSKESAKHSLEIFHFNPNNPQIIGTIAHFYHVKGLSYLIEAAKLLSSTFPNILFLLIGGGQEHKKLQNLIEKYKLENNIFLIDEIKNASKLLKVFDIFVLPSLKEGCPYMILDAMAAEIPIIASRVGGIPEQITDEKEGLLVEPKANHILTAKIKLLLSNKELGERLAKNAKEKVEREFTLEKMVEETRKIYLSNL